MPTKKKAKARKTAAAARKRRRAVPKRCFFCVKGKQPSVGEYEILEPFLTRRGKIRGRRRSGLCSKHQRMLAKEIKKARNLGLLPYRIIG
jgi:small subunit ribosomal protein S18